MITSHSALKVFSIYHKTISSFLTTLQYLIASIYSSLYENYVVGASFVTVLFQVLTVTMDKHFMMILSTSSANESE